MADLLFFVTKNYVKYFLERHKKLCQITRSYGHAPFFVTLQPFVKLTLLYQSIFYETSLQYTVHVRQSKKIFFFFCFFSVLRAFLTKETLTVDFLKMYIILASYYLGSILVRLQNVLPILHIVFMEKCLV